MGEQLVACATISSGPGDMVHYVDGREAALACPETFVPVDAAIIGFVEQVSSSGLLLETDCTAVAPTAVAPTAVAPNVVTQKKGGS